MNERQVLKVSGGASELELAAVLASLAEVRRRAPTRTAALHPWRAVRLAALGLTPRARRPRSQPPR